eukprot:Pompholyxophrys_punicea_v1_NODE_931_length_1126_cov_7.971989.p1 type:complete len:130 gc:universal NODE_931_length_1126_cov_7.971989:173-562(+)
MTKIPSSESRFIIMTVRFNLLSHQTMKGVKLIDCFPHTLKSLDDYKSAYLSLAERFPYFQALQKSKVLIVVVPDFPGNVYTRKLHYQRIKALHARNAMVPPQLPHISDTVSSSISCPPANLDPVAMYPQ